MSGNLIFARDDTTNTLHPVACDSGGHIESKMMGSEDPADPSATQRQIHIDGSGNVMVKEVGTVNVAPSNDTNSGITDDPANSVAVGMRARTNINQSATEVFLKADSNGILQVNEDSEYQDETLGNAANLLVYGSTSDPIDMEGHTHLVIQATATATAGASSVQNLQMYYSLDNTNYVLGEVLQQNNVPGATTQYAGFIRLERTGFRYVKLFAIGVTQSPSAYVIKYSRT